MDKARIAMDKRRENVARAIIKVAKIGKKELEVAWMAAESAVFAGQATDSLFDDLAKLDSKEISVRPHITRGEDRARIARTFVGHRQGRNC